MPQTITIPLMLLMGALAQAGTVKNSDSCKLIFAGGQSSNLAPLSQDAAEKNKTKAANYANPDFQILYDNPDEIFESLKRPSSTVSQVDREISDSGGTHGGVYLIRLESGREYVLKLSRITSPEWIAKMKRSVAIQKTLAQAGVSSDVVGVLEPGEVRNLSVAFKSLTFRYSDNERYLGLIMALQSNAVSGRRISVTDAIKFNWPRGKLMDGLEKIRQTLKILRIGTGADFPQYLINDQGRITLMDPDNASLITPATQDRSLKSIDSNIDDQKSKLERILDERDRELGRVHLFEGTIGNRQYSFPIYDEDPTSAQERAQQKLNKLATLIAPGDRIGHIIPIESHAKAHRYKVTLSFELSGRSDNDRRDNSYTVDACDQKTAEVFAIQSLADHSRGSMYPPNLATVKSKQVIAMEEAR